MLKQGKSAVEVWGISEASVPGLHHAIDQALSMSTELPVEVTVNFEVGIIQIRRKTPIEGMNVTELADLISTMDLVRVQPTSDGHATDLLKVFFAAAKDNRVCNFLVVGDLEKFTEWLGIGNDPKIVERAVPVDMMVDPTGTVPADTIMVFSGPQRSSTYTDMDRVAVLTFEDEEEAHGHD